MSYTTEGCCSGAKKLLEDTPAKNVLFMEGPEDLAVYPKWLEKLASPIGTSPRPASGNASGRPKFYRRKSDKVLQKR